MVQPDEQQREMLQLFCDTIVPSIDHAPDPHGFWARTATDTGTDVAILQVLDTLPEADASGLLLLLDVLAQMGFGDADQTGREELLRTLSDASTEATVGITALTTLTLAMYYVRTNPVTRQNPNFATFGYPGPLSAPPQQDKTITPLRPSEDRPLRADVVIIGSGAGGGVIAGELAQEGLRVIVVEAGGHFDEGDFNQSELWAYQNLYWRGGATTTADGNIAMLAGACLGGGTVINWTNSLRTKQWVRDEWATEHGLTDIGDDFDRHLDAVWNRLTVTDQCSDLNGPQQAMRRGAEALGWSFARTHRNTDIDRYDPVSAGYMGFGDQSGAKQSTLRTYLQDAVDHDAQIIVGCTVERILGEHGRAAGIAATWTDPATGHTIPVTVRTPRVVVAAGSLESPGILLRSRIGGPATGKYLRLHPCTAVMGIYDDDMQAWWGPPHAGLIDEFATANNGYGFLIEGIQYGTGTLISGQPWTSGEQHKHFVAELARAAVFIGLTRDRGSGQVTIDAAGRTAHTYAVDDERDQATIRAALAAQIRCHAAAGADRILVAANGSPTWRRGDTDLDTYIRDVERIPLTAGAMSMFSAHQMGSCRMGDDPATSVADPRGELHDTPGVWIGDASAFPTSSGSNPMITIMALAHRTAEHILRKG